MVVDAGNRARRQKTDRYAAVSRGSSIAIRLSPPVGIRGLQLKLMMTPLPPTISRLSNELVAWRIDRKQLAASWDSGIGAEMAGGRWNPKGAKAVYCCLDPSTSIVEVAVHRTWLHGGIPSLGQQQFGANLLAKYSFVIIPSSVSKLSWNLVFDPLRALGKYTLRSQAPLVLDTRLNPPPALH
jgi:RES domain-containing protein